MSVPYHESSGPKAAIGASLSRKPVNPAAG
jgi:hypothetical protein